MSGFLLPFIQVTIIAIDIYWWAIIIYAVASWLVAFGVVNTRNQLVSMVLDTLYRVTEPALRPIRRILPNLGGIDISPIILLLIIWFIREELVQFGFYIRGL